jgi:hypothetical protein
MKPKKEQRFKMLTGIWKHYQPPGQVRIYEDELPDNITKEEYDDFYENSVVDFVRYRIISDEKGGPNA